MRTSLLVTGTLAILVGALWVGQGTGYVNWPQSSFMISRIHWAYYGTALGIIGLLMIVFARGR